MVGYRSLQMVLKSNFDPNVGVCLVLRECLYIWSRNLMGHNEDVVFVTFHIGYKKKFLVLYKYGLISILYMRFKTVKTLCL